MDGHHSSVQYELLAEIGKGAYGKVYKARDLKKNGMFVALKRIDIPRREEGIPFLVIREVACLKKLAVFDHPNVIRLFDVHLTLQNDQMMKLTLVSELIDQDLSTLLMKADKQGLPNKKIKDMMIQLFRGLDFLHLNHVVHRDLKPQNILVSSIGQVKLADFGLARVYTFNMALTPLVVTLWYRAPEILLYSGYASGVDIWSVGCIFAEMVQLRPLLCGISDIDQLHKIFEARVGSVKVFWNGNALGQPPEMEGESFLCLYQTESLRICEQAIKSMVGLPKEVDWPADSPLPYSSFTPRPNKPVEDIVPKINSLGKDLLHKCLHFSPGRRISTYEALAHPYFIDTSEHFDAEF